MRIEEVIVPWWNTYPTLLIVDPPHQPTPEQMRELRKFIIERKPLFYVPLPFLNFTDIAPLRHYPHDRWIACTESLGGIEAYARKRMIDLGSNLGYYAFLAAAAGALDAIALDASELAMEMAQRAAYAYGIGNFRTAGPMLIERFDFEAEQIDIAFAFSCLPYIGQPDPEPLKAVLRSMAEHVGVSFIEMGDGGSELPWCQGDEAFKALFEDCGFAKVTALESIFASHTNTQRTLWRCDGRSAVS